MDSPRIFVVRAEYGKYAEDFKTGGYAAVGWIPEIDLSGFSVDEVRAA